MSLNDLRNARLSGLGLWLTALMLSACSVDTATQEAVATKQTEAAQQAPAVDSRQPEIAQQAPAVESPQPEPAKQSPAAPIAAAGPDPVAAPSDSAATSDISCAIDADCEVKDMGNCCGRMPACVNRAVVPDTAAVQAECARKGESGICGFQELSGCNCVASRCVGIPGMGDGGDVR